MSEISPDPSKWLSEYMADASLGVELPYDLLSNSELMASSYIDVVVSADNLPDINSNRRHQVLRWLAAFIILLSRYSSGDEVCIAIEDSRLDIVPLILRTNYIPDEKPDEWSERLERELKSVAGYFNELSIDVFNTLIPCQVMMLQSEKKIPSQVRIAIRVLESIQEVRLYLDKSMFSAAVAAGVAAHLKTIHKAFETSSPSSVAAIPLLEQDERQKLLYDFSGQGCESFPVGLVHHLFLQQAKQTPHHIALFASDRTITFSQLQSESNYLARSLIKQGVKPDIRVGVCLPRTSSLVVGLLGVLIAGGCYVPIDSKYPDDRLCYMLSDADCAFVLVDQETEHKIANLGYPTLLMPTNLHQEQIGLDSPIITDMTASNLAYIIYTSGSTGQPKGISIEHRSVYSFLCWADQVFKEEERGGMLASTSVCFDLSIFEIFAPLCNGGTVHLIDNVLALADYSQRGQIRLINTVPSAMAALLSLGPLPSSVTTVNLAGEALPSYLAQALWSCDSVKRVLNLYGPSEDTTYSTWAELSPEDLAEPPIGRPLPGTTVYVLDSSGQLLPIGVPGELYIGGAGLAREYWRKKEQTAARFVFKTFDDHSPIRLYRTGDRVRFRSNGTLEHLGRLDEQVKIRGFRIELNEISSVLVEFATIEEAITIVREAEDGNKQLVAYYVATDAPDKSSVVAWLTKRLPHYMRPSILVELPDLPKTLNGKIDKKRLPEPAEVMIVNLTAVAIPQDPAERTVFEVWTDVLGSTPERHSNFFSIGGNSLQAVQIIARVQNQLGIVIFLSQFLGNPTPEGLLDLVKNSSTVSSSAFSHQLSDSQEEATLTLAERRLWVQQQFDLNDTSYLLTAHLHIEGDVEIPALIEALRDLLKQHKSLRRAIVLRGGLPHPVFLPVKSVPIVVENRVKASAAKSTVVSLSNEDNSRPFHLDKEAPIRIRILPVESGAIELLLTIHHISFDDWSLEVFAQDLVTAYENPLSPVPSVPSTDLAARELASRKSPVKQAAVDRWAQKIGNMSFDLQLGNLQPEQTPRSSAGEVYDAQLSEEANQTLTTIAQKLETTKFAVFMAVFESLVWLETGANRFLVGLALAGRSQLDTERIIGCFVNMLPLLAEIEPHLSFKSLVKKVSQGVFDLIMHQDIPLEYWLETLRKYRPSDHQNLVRVACSAHNARQGEPIWGEQMNVSARFLPNTKARLDLTLWMEEREDQLHLLWTYANDLFTREFVVRCHHKFEQLLFIIEPDQNISLQKLASISEPKSSSTTYQETLKIASDKNSRRFDNRIFLKPKRSDDFVQVEKNWLEGNLPLLIEAKVPGISLAEWIRSRQNELRQDIAHHGGILFRGFSINAVPQFAAAARAFAPDLLNYKEKSSPRTFVENQIYTSTDHPVDQPIFLHSEQSYTTNWPAFIMFFCLAEANDGGRTPIADNRKILKRLSDRIVSRFSEKGILYVRNYLPGISLSWQDAFQTNNQSEVEQFCQENYIRWHWISENHLRTWQRRSAFQLHPVSGELLWFNHGVFFHATSLLPQVRNALLDAIPEEDLPYNTYYGDGSPIDYQTLETIRAAVSQETVHFDWHRRDLLILDNMLTQHGREPYQGSRQILTAMATPYCTIASPIILETPQDYIPQVVR